MHWMSLKGLGGNMKRKIIRRVAKNVVNLCDWMNGYHGKLIEDGIKIALMVTPMVFFTMWFAIVMS